jgi:hypothetical protein
VFAVLSAVVMNSFVIWSFTVRRKTVVSIDYYILTLAISDLCSPVLAYPLAMTSMFSHGWIFGHTGQYKYVYLFFCTIICATLSSQRFEPPSIKGPILILFLKGLYRMQYCVRLCHVSMTAVHNNDKLSR